MVPFSGWNPRNSSIFWSSASSSTDPVYFNTKSVAFGDPSAYEIFISWKQKSFHVEEISRRDLYNSRNRTIWEESLELMEATELLEQSSDITYHQNQLDQD